MSEILGLFVIGAGASVSICTFACLGYLAPVLLSEGDGFRVGLSQSLAFLGGKILLYALLGAIVGWSGSHLFPTANGGAGFVTGAFLILLGFWFHFRREGSCHNRPRPRHTGLLMLTGAFTSILPCPAVLTMLALAAQSGSATLGLLYGLSYGAGLLLSPVILAGGGLSMISRDIRIRAAEFFPLIRTIAAGIIIISGLRLILSAL